MKSSQSFKVLTAGVVLATGLFTALPTNGTALAVMIETTPMKAPALKSTDFKTFEELKQIAIDLYNSPGYQPKDVVVYSKTDFNDQFVDYFYLSADVSQDISGYTFYGRGVGIDTITIYEEGKVYKYTLSVYNDREKEDELVWSKKMDAAEKYIVDNYRLDTDYDVVLAVNDFIADQLEYGMRIPEPHPYLEFRGNMSTCTGYADLAATLYARFGVSSSLVRGNNSKGGTHAWNAVKVGDNWYHSDSQLYGYGHGQKRNVKYILMTESERNTTATTRDTHFKATDVQFEMSMAKPYSYEEVKKAQVKMKEVKKAQTTKK